MIVERIGSLVRLRLNRPEVLNALNREMAEAFLAAAREIAGDPSVRAVMLSGEGRAFMAGGDIASFREEGKSIAETVANLIDPFHEAILTLRAANAPIVAALHGPVAGAGMSLALACDLAVAAEDMKMVMAYSAIGTSPDGSGTFFLPRLVGIRRAMELALLNEPVKAGLALEWGLVNWVVPREMLEEETLNITERLAEGATKAFGATRRLLEGSLGASLANQLEAEKRSFQAMTGTADFIEGNTAFLEKRKPIFVGE
ncbi:MAG: enoyl-CoA hydratase/isomerase family protein [Rhodospirillum sp.]|nr:enoyl-CoA hydratase/isomerase family protein [Rhodospirillum sp.]MCF8491678.1 enoyl-CoA hydratase/isomerase family protein [Rhodospirillum sp.]